MATNKDLLDFMRQRNSVISTIWEHKDRSFNRFYEKHNGYKEKELIKWLLDLQEEYLECENNVPKKDDQGKEIYKEGKDSEGYERATEVAFSKHVTIKFPTHTI